MESVSLFLAFLTFGGVAVLVALPATLALGRRPGNSALLADLQAQSMKLAFVVAAAATTGSLYYSEVAGFEPCRLCWIQRGFMYPSALLLAVALWRRHVRIIPLVLSVAGLGVSVYHRAEQQFPDSIGGSCDIANPCSGRWVDTFGFVTIPTMAAVAFALVAALLSLSFIRRPTGDEVVENKLLEEVS